MESRPSQLVVPGAPIGGYVTSSPLWHIEITVDGSKMSISTLALMDVPERGKPKPGTFDVLFVAEASKARETLRKGGLL